MGEVEHGPKRILHLVLGCGSLALALVGIIIPGIPTVPFLLAGCYFLARSSPPLDQKLHAPFFGPILQEWESHQALSRTSKAKLVGLTLTVVLVTVVLVPFTPPVLAMIVLVVAVNIYEIARVPDLAEEPRNGRAHPMPTQVLLATP